MGAAAMCTRAVRPLAENVVLCRAAALTIKAAVHRLVQESKRRVLGGRLHAGVSRSCQGRANLLPIWEDPVGTRKVTGVPLWSLFEIILMLRLGFPECSDGLYLRHDLGLPKAGRIHVGYGFIGDVLLIVVDVVDRRSIRAPNITTLTIGRRRVVDLKEILEYAPITRFCRIEDDLDSFCMITMVAIGGVRSVTTGITDAGRENPRKLSDQVLHAPKAPAGKYSALMHVRPPRPGPDIRRSPRSPCRRDG